MKKTIETLKAMGFKIIYRGKKNENGPDLWITKTSKPISVECKKARLIKSGCLQVAAVEPNRRNDDLIAINVNNKYILIEPMKDHLRSCSRKGFRSLTELR